MAVIIVCVPDIRAVVTDLDGTIVDAEKTVSHATVRAAADLARRGIPLLLATARTPSWVAGLTSLTPYVRVAACCGGAVGWSPATRDILWRDTIPPEDVDRILRFTAQHMPTAGIAVYDASEWRVTSEYAARGPKRRGPTQIVAADHLADRPACAMSVFHPGSMRDGLLRVLTETEPPLTAESSATDVTDIAAPGTDKARGVKRALAAAGADPAHAIAFGDMPPDLPMFAVSGYSVAVANAHPDVIAAATMVAACVHNDGFARTLGDLGLVTPYRPPDVRGCGCPEIGTAPAPTR
jgi:Cof subfamily protein (haloacid dehalogenase superfamily)